jgi:omega-amidase
MQHLKIAYIQTILYWEEPGNNLKHFSEKIGEIKEAVDLIVLPEMFTTGFTMHPHGVAEPMIGPTMEWMAKHALERSCVVTGSMIIEEKGHYYNRLVWMPPDGRFQYYDKMHLFSHAKENEYYSRGQKKLIVELKGWKIRPLICYDLRFPVWSRNRFIQGEGFDYDCLLFVANWPSTRSHAWRILLMARAIENMCYVVGVNRIGLDGYDIPYSGDSVVLGPLGESLSKMLPNADETEIITLEPSVINNHRDTFRAWADWDSFD